MASASLPAEGVLEQWASAWSSHDVEKVIPLFTDDCVYEDATMGVVNHGKAELKAFAASIFGVFPDFAIRLTNQFAAGSWGGGGVDDVRDAQG